MLQQVTAEVQPRLAAQANTAVSLDRTRMVNIIFSHHFFCSWYILGVWQSTFHTPVVEEVAGPRDICQAVLTAILPSGALQQLFECLPQSLPDITYWTKTWIQSVWVPKTMPWRKHNKLTRSDTAGIVAAALAVSSCIFIFMKRLHRTFAFVGDPSYSLVLDWRSRSTRRSIHMNEPK